MHVARVGNVLGGQPDRVEDLLRVLDYMPWAPSEQLALDLGNVNFVRPYGALQLLRVCEEFSGRTGWPVRIQGIQPDVHAYLRRIDFFDAADASAFTSEPFTGTELSRSPSSTNLIAITRIASEDDVPATVESTRRILEYWLDRSTDDIGRVCTLISEACMNVAWHSESYGWVLAQKYEEPKGGRVAVEVAVSDAGIGIRQSLEQAHGPLGGGASDCIKRALRGLTRRVGEQGLGLRSMLEIAAESGGYLFLRSDDGRVRATGPTLLGRDRLVPLEGTQVAMRFGAPF